MTNDPDIRFASSLVDYVFRRLALDHLPPEQREALGIRSIEERKAEAEQKIGELRGRTTAQPSEPRRRAAAADRRSREKPDGEGPGRAALLPVRLEDAAGRLVLRLRRRAAAPAAARRLPPFERPTSRPGVRPGPLPSRRGRCEGGENSRSCWGCTTSSSRCRRARRRRRSSSTAPCSGSTQVDKPPELAPRGGVWFRDGDLEVHLGVEEPVHARRARRTPRSSCEDLETLRERIETAGYRVTDDVPLEGFHRGVTCAIRSATGSSWSSRSRRDRTCRSAALRARGAAAVGAAPRRRRPRPRARRSTSTSSRASAR